MKYDLQYPSHIEYPNCGYFYRVRAFAPGLAYLLGLAA